MNQIYLTGFSDEICEDFDKQLQVVSKFGLKYIEIRGVDGKNIAVLSDEERQAVKEKLDKYGVSISAIGSPIGKIGIEKDFEPHFEQFKNVIETAKFLNTKYIRMFSFYIPQEEPAEKYQDAVMKRLSCFVEYAKQKDVVLLHENEKGIYGDTAERCAEICEKFHGENFKAVFDFANFVECGVDTKKAYALLKPYIAYIHIKDALKKEKAIVPAGDGDGNVAEILVDLKAEKYSGFLSIEPHLVNFSGLQALEYEAKERSGGMDPETAWALALRSLKSILWDIDWR
jgi:Sugar phosphate isomerases/epimerases